ncbi:MAG: helix-hairpin-helix domain-containing protein [Candidatus Omnitrophota bacterium]
MFNFTPEERRVALFLLGLAFCGLILSNLIKLNCRMAGVAYPRIQLAKLDINKISLSELIGLKCVPVKLAQRIIEHRNARQAFGSLEELTEVKGIGQQRLEKLKDIFFIE